MILHNNYAFFIDSTNLELTKTECDVFAYLLARKGEIISSLNIDKGIYKRILLNKSYSPTIAGHVLKIRQKLKKVTPELEYIKTFPGSGYLFVV